MLEGQDCCGAARLEVYIYIYIYKSIYMYCAALLRLKFCNSFENGNRLYVSVLSITFFGTMTGLGLGVVRGELV